MSRFFRLSISEHASILELVVEVPNSLSVTDQYLNQVATTVAAQRWRQLHQNPPWFPSKFQIEAISDFNPSGIQGVSTEVASHKTQRVTVAPRYNNLFPLCAPEDVHLGQSAWANH